MVLKDLNMIAVFILRLLRNHLYTCCYMLMTCLLLPRAEKITTVKKLLSSEFDMKDLGVAKKILGMEITRDRKSGLLFLSQHNYINKVLQCFNMHDSKP